MSEPQVLKEEGGASARENIHGSCVQVNPFTLSRPNRPDDFGTILLRKAFFGKHLKEKFLLEATQQLLSKIFCELLLNSQVIFKSMRVADNTFLKNSQCEWLTHSCFQVNL